MHLLFFVIVHNITHDGVGRECGSTGPLKQILKYSGRIIMAFLWHVSNRFKRSNAIWRISTRFGGSLDNVHRALIVDAAWDGGEKGRGTTPGGQTLVENPMGGRLA